jgi:hypothetical protein
MITIHCQSCGHENVFDQPYPFHAGFGDQGFLYNDSGNLTLVWSAFDPAYESIVGRQNPWILDKEKQSLFENALRDPPFGGKWRFSNAARCLKCSNPISGSMSETIYYLRYPNSIDTDERPQARQLADFLK